MPQTKDHAKYAKTAGKTLYVATTSEPIYCSEDCCGKCVMDDRDGDGRTFPNLGLAKSWLEKTLTKLGGDWRGYIEAGHYELHVIHDREYGTVHDVNWIHHDHFSVNAWRTDRGIEFDVWDD